MNDNIKNPVVILISGKAQHGKDTVAKLLTEKLEERGQKVLVTHFGDLLKYICKSFFKWDGKKDEKGRSLLQKVGTESIRFIYPDYWVNFIKEILQIFHNEWDYVIIPDTRFSNELNDFDDCFPTVKIRVNRPNFDNKLTETQKNHVSETALDTSNFDYYVNNVDMEYMKTQIDTILKIEPLFEQVEEKKCKKKQIKKKNNNKIAKLREKENSREETKQ